MPGMIERYNGQRVVSLTANIHGITLGEAAHQLNAAHRPRRRAAQRRERRVTAARSRRSNRPSADLRVGLLLAVLVIFLLLAANFQSIRLALAIVLTIPAVLCGVLLMLRLTGTTLNVQSFMGAIMAIGIAVANSILLVTFAEHARHRRHAALRCRARRRQRPPARDSDDRARHDLRHAAHGHGLRRRRWTDRAAGPRRDRRADRFHLRHAEHSALALRDLAEPGID